MIFDISEDELPIFQAETEDHLTNLEDGLVKLEQNSDEPELLNTLFRAAHTIKGMAGVIGHKRLVEITHVLENALDAVRKGELKISTPLINLCLDTVDILRMLRDEVATNEEASCDVDQMVDTFRSFLEKSVRKQDAEQKSDSDKNSKSVDKVEVKNVKTEEKKSKNPNEKIEEKILDVQVDISPTSVASAARAFQILIILQSSGKLLSLLPDQSTIESAAPVDHLVAKIILTKEIEQFKKELKDIPEIDRLIVGSETIINLTKNIEDILGTQEITDIEIPKLGSYLIEKSLITTEQLKAALEKQKSYPAESAPLLGQILVAMGLLTKDVIDQALNETMQQKREIVQSVNEGARLGDHVLDRTVRTSVERLDALMNLVGELITDRNRLIKIHSHLDQELRGNENINVLADAVVHLGRITDQLQEEVMHIRMLPVANVFKKFPRMVRDMAQKTGKDIDLVLKGQETELDRSVIEEINDPLIHLIRNSVDHGIESPEKRKEVGKEGRGTIILSARHDQGRIILTVEDDGSGINIDKLKAASVRKGMITQQEADLMDPDKAIDLIFESGLSTAEKVSDISGRGVGMDIVRNNIEKLNGSILVETNPGKGTQFQIILPLTLAIVPTLLVKVKNSIFAIPLMTVVETQKLVDQKFQTVNGKPVVVLRDKIIPLIKLSEIFDLEAEKGNVNYAYIVVVKTSKQEVGIVVEHLLGEEEVVVKSFGSLIGELPGISSAAILGDGQIALIVDIQGLLKLSAN